MRATVLLKDDLVVKARKLSPHESLSGLLNACLADWIARHGRKQLEARLAAEYRDGEADARRVGRPSFSRPIKRRKSWVAVLKACPVPMDDLPARGREYSKKPKL